MLNSDTSLEPSGLARHIVNLTATVEHFLALNATVESQKGQLANQAAELEQAGARVRQLQENLDSACRLSTVGHLAAGIAHEMNTPAQFIGDNLTFLQENFQELIQVIDCLRKDGSQADLSQFDLDYLLREIPEAIEASQEGLNRVNRIVQAMRRCSCSNSARKEPIAIEELVSSCLAVSAGEWKYVAKTEVKLEPDLPAVSGFREDLARVLLVLLVVAAQSIRDKGEVGLISIRARRHHSYVELTIEDDGAGIPAEIQSHLYDPFFNQRPAGYGNGQEFLMARQVIVDQHRGHLSFHSVPGEGSRFVVELPLAS